jgi:hypothetical protein
VFFSSCVCLLLPQEVPGEALLLVTWSFLMSHVMQYTASCPTLYAVSVAFAFRLLPQEVPGEALLPGDVVSICRPKGGPGAEDKVVPAGALCPLAAALFC